MHYLVTGHTGFKGAWMTMWLTSQGHQVSGLALDPEPGALFETAKLHPLLAHDIRADIRDSANVMDALRVTAPDVVIHLAAQPLVRESYLNPRWTFETNVMGTMNVLEAVQQTPSVKTQLIITTDKVYRNVNQVAGYVEPDPLGGDDPYSASKAMADLLTHSWVTSFGGPPTAVARAGNVIGGGDVCKDRLIPDVIAALASGKAPVLRYPNAVRPWQHVLDCINGYLMLVD
ncbi:MAG: CDP-glucose 4,6-dehydratase, partial [Candidatus Nanopelagicales bacterium]